MDVDFIQIAGDMTFQKIFLTKPGVISCGREYSSYSQATDTNYDVVNRTREVRSSDPRNIWPPSAAPHKKISG